MKNWDELYAECMSCRKCDLAETRTNVVWRRRPKRRDYVHRGGPGEQEDLTGLPFVGRAGKLLDDMLAMIDLDRSRVFVGNMVSAARPRTGTLERGAGGLHRISAQPGGPD